jgi:hypothetical protein
MNRYGRGRVGQLSVTLKVLRMNTHQMVSTGLLDPLPQSGRAVLGSCFRVEVLLTTLIPIIPIVGNTG